MPPAIASRNCRSRRKRSGGSAMSTTPATKPLQLTINGKAVGPMDVPDGLMMLDFLHEYADLTGSRLGCGIGECRACVVIVDKDDGSSEERRTCITGAQFFAGK